MSKSTKQQSSPTRLIISRSRFSGPYSRLRRAMRVEKRKRAVHHVTQVWADEKSESPASGLKATNRRCKKDRRVARNRHRRDCEDAASVGLCLVER